MMTQEITLSDLSVVQMPLQHAQIETLERYAGDLVITMVDGQAIIVHGFFVDGRGEGNDELVLRDGEPVQVAGLPDQGMLTDLDMRVTEEGDVGASTDVSANADVIAPPSDDDDRLKLVTGVGLGAMATGVGAFDLTGVTRVAGGTGGDTFTDSAAGNDTFEGRAGNDTFNFIHGGHDTRVYQPQASNPGDAAGGNGTDEVDGFTVGQFEPAPNADRIDVSQLLIGYAPSASCGPARYVNGTATIDVVDAITDYLSVSRANGNTTLLIDHGGSAAADTPAALLVLNNTNVALATLLANHQIVLR
jgi:O-acetyl-ADP-ribose deacetylase (regulator of RNase III)